MKAKTVTTRCWAEASPSAPALVGLKSPFISPTAKPRGRSSAPLGPMFCRSRHGSPRRGPNGKTPALVAVRLHFAARNRAGRSSAPLGPMFCRSRHGCAAPGPQRQSPGACSRSVAFRCAKPRGRSSAPPGPMFCRSRHGCAAPGPQRQNPGALCLLS